jgi:hypothetical protein
MNIGDQITVTNHPERHTRQLTGQQYLARWAPKQHQAYEALFLGWTNVWSGTFVEKRIEERLVKDAKGEHYITNEWVAGRMLTQHAVRIAVVQPIAGKQWRKPKHTMLPEQPHACPCGKQADHNSGYCPECAWLYNDGARLAKALDAADGITVHNQHQWMFALEGRGALGYTADTILDSDPVMVHCITENYERYNVALTGDAAKTWLMWLENNPYQYWHIDTYYHNHEDNIAF